MCVCVCVCVCLSVYKFMCVLKKIRLMNTQLECLLIANFLYVFCVTTCWRKYAKIFDIFCRMENNLLFTITAMSNLELAAVII